MRMELVLLLQELGQEKQHQQLLSPLPFPTTLPLLAAAVATNNTVVADPVRHLQVCAFNICREILIKTNKAYCEFVLFLNTYFSR